KLGASNSIIADVSHECKSLQQMMTVRETQLHRDQESALDEMKKIFEEIAHRATNGDGEGEDSATASELFARFAQATRQGAEVLTKRAVVTSALALWQWSLLFAMVLFAGVYPTALLLLLAMFLLAAVYNRAMHMLQSPASLFKSYYMHRRAPSSASAPARPPPPPPQLQPPLPPPGNPAVVASAAAATASHSVGPKKLLMPAPRMGKLCTARRSAERDHPGFARAN
ncbi:hypothetical protein KEM55_008153, partial [Ascosphaera atra]